ncbi:MAG: endopeptidase La [Clostridia bacterium]|nr:endopeptidase La [Clostridia bacterium]MBR5428320.1 endopeptidase La [Clostridia bacterium]
METEFKKKHISVPREMPVVPLRDTVLFPGTNLQFEVYGPVALTAVKKAMDGDQRAFFAAQKDATVETPRFGDLYLVGCVGKIRQVRRMMDRAALSVSVDGGYRAIISKKLPSVECLTAVAVPLTERPQEETNYVTALMRQGKELFRRYASLAHPDAHVELPPLEGPGELADLIANEFPLELDEKQELIEELDPVKRLESVNIIVLQEIDLLELETEINEKVQDKLDRGQREYYLREQMHTIAEELGEEGDPTSEYDTYMKRIDESAMPEDCKKKLSEEAGRLRTMSPSSPDANVSRTYLDRCLALPWGKYSRDNLDISHARRVLERDHYGMADVKERVIELIAAMSVAPDIKGQIICFAGPPGVGKTSVVRSIAKALGRKYQRISLGGIHDEAEIRGHRRTYIGSMPGRIINAVIDAGTANPVILLDEIDKTAGDFRGDPSSALLEALDGEQNNTFTDHYIDMPFDLSKVLFITTANDKYAIPGPLQDRMEIIDLYSYTAEEKFHIAKRHLVKRQLKEHNIKPASLRITDKAIRLMIEGYTREAGVRQLERQIAKICRKTAVFLAEDPDCRTVVNEKNLTEFLGARKFRPEDDDREDAVGLVNGLAWTSVGGELLTVETAVLDGTGKIELTGSLGDVMKESARAAVSYVRSRADALHIDKEFYKNKDIHIHVPEGAVPKDGPSAGVTMTTSLVSALSGVPVRGTTAMTGEVTLRGRVLPIGGLKEKTMAAYKAGMKQVVIPYGNVPDLEKIDEAVRNGLSFLPVKTVDEVLDIALTKKPGGGTGDGANA